MVQYGAQYPEADQHDQEYEPRNRDLRESNNLHIL